MVNAASPSLRLAAFAFAREQQSETSGSYPSIVKAHAAGQAIWSGTLVLPRRHRRLHAPSPVSTAGAGCHPATLRFGRHRPIPAVTCRRVDKATRGPYVPGNLCSDQSVYGRAGVLIGAIAFGSLEARHNGCKIPDRVRLNHEKIGRLAAILRLEVAVADSTLDHAGNNAVQSPEMFAEGWALPIDGEEQNVTAWRLQRQEVQAEAILVQKMIDKLLGRFDGSARIRCRNLNSFLQHPDDDRIKLLSGGQGVGGEHTRIPENGGSS